MAQHGYDQSWDSERVTAWISEHWTADDMAAFDSIGAEAFFAWVERGSAVR